MKKGLIIGLALILLIIIARLVPHLPNFTPVGAIALTAAIYLRGKSRWLIPLVGMLMSDILIGTYHLPIMLTVYGSFAAIYIIGLAVKKNKTLITSLTGVLAASLLFFLVTNFAVWHFGSWYPHTLTGLYLSYLMAIPFFKATLAGNIFYFAILASSFELAHSVQRHRLTTVGTKLQLTNPK